MRAANFEFPDDTRATWVFFIETHNPTFFVLSTFEFFDQTWTLRRY
jgi:hypothetical protein